jgi:hypothetical protein
LQLPQPSPVGCSGRNRVKRADGVALIQAGVPGNTPVWHQNQTAVALMVWADNDMGIPPPR